MVVWCVAGRHVAARVVGVVGVDVDVHGAFVLLCGCAVVMVVSLCGSGW